MTAQLKDVSSPTGSTGTSNDEHTLGELREMVAGLAKDISAIAERRAKQGAQAVETGSAELRRQIRRQPAVAMGAAAVAGALLAILIVPKSRPRTPVRRWADWAPVTRADLEDVADSIQRSVKRATKSVNSIPVSSAMERVADALTRADREAGVSSTLEKIGSWLNARAQTATSKKKS